MKKAVLVAVMLCLCPAVFAASVITTRLDDPKAIYVDASCDQCGQFRRAAGSH